MKGDPEHNAIAAEQRDPRKNRQPYAANSKKKGSTEEYVGKLYVLEIIAVGYCARQC